MAQSRSRTPDQYFPPDWGHMADLRVLRAKAEEWDKLSTWRRDMSRLGWRLLQVSSTENELIAVFGKTKKNSV